MNQEMKKRFEEFKVVLAQTYPLQHISPHPQYELDILAFIQSEIDLALANRNKEIKNILLNNVITIQDYGQFFKREVFEEITLQAKE